MDGEEPTPLPRPAKTLLLHTSLLGDLPIQGDPKHASELQALSARAAVYTTRARRDGILHRLRW